MPIDPATAVTAGHARAARAADPARDLPVGRFERLPKWLNLVPMVLQWAWLGLRHRSFTLPSAANPGITAGGLVGEGKLEYFGSMGAVARAATADFVGVANARGRGVHAALVAMRAAGLDFPVIAKPDLGWCGYGVRLLRDEAALRDYQQRFPDGETFLLQRYLPEPGEAGLFYMREPGDAHGQLIGILLRHYPSVLGNGIDSVATLAARDPRLARGGSDPAHEPGYDASHVPAAGERVRLSTVASTRVGGTYEDGSDFATPTLSGRVDAIARDMGVFLAGRFDVRYRDVAALQRGEFSIMEVNGAGSEAVHAWDPKYSIADVYRIVFAKQRLLFRIAAANRRLGHRPIGLLPLARLFLRQHALLRRYPPSN